MLTKSDFLKAFFAYAYAFMFIFMFNSLILSLFVKLDWSPFVGRILTYAISPPLLFFSYMFSIKKFLKVDVDNSKLFKAWILQFIPFVIISFIVLWFLISLISKPSLTIFIFLNIELLVIYFTFKLSVEKVLFTGK
ncbi:MAG: hypothetical protein ABGX27_00850 [Desulfurobacteriaceae bacterium]